MNKLINKGLVTIIVLIAVLFASNAFAQNQVVGSVNYGNEEDAPLSNVQLGLYDEYDSLIMTSNTDLYGFYEFTDVPNGEYYLRSTTDQAPGEIDLSDAYFIMLHLFGMYDFTDVQFAAADVNNSNSVNWVDYIIIVINYLLEGEPFPAGEWQFDEHYINFSSRAESDTVMVWGVGTGDVVIVWEPSGRSFGSLYSADYPVVTETNKFQIEVRSDYNKLIGGYNLNLGYPSDMINIVDIQGPDDNLKYHLNMESGLIKVIWLNENLQKNSSVHGDVLLTLTVESKKTNLEQGIFTLLPGGLILDQDGANIEDVEISLPLIKNAAIVDWNVTAYPNPVVDQLNFNFSMPQVTTADLFVYDSQGRMINEHNNISLAKGVQQFTLNTQTYKPGHYYYVITFGNDLQKRVHGRFYRSSK